MGSAPAPRTARHGRAGLLKGMWLGRGFTAARRQASRLAGLVWLRANWIGKTAVGRQALRLAEKGQRGFEPTLAFYVTKIFKER